MEIKDFLRGYQADIHNAQVAGNMTVIPLVSEQEFTSAVAEVDEITLNRDISYGELQFENQSGRIGILMQGATIITQQSAQDRTIPRAVIMKGKAVSKVNAFCVQSSQGGLMNTQKLPEEFGDEPPYMILPPILRSNALQISGRGGHSYSNLWNALESYSSTYHGMMSTSHLRDIYDRFRESLDSFCAQFEPVPNQLGAIVLINGKVIAVDIMPTHLSWKKMWRTLIRDSYGAEAIRLQGDTDKKDAGVVWNYGLDLNEVTDLDSLEAEMHKAVDQLLVAIRQEWEKVDKEAVTTRVDNTISGISLVNVETSKFVGQAVIHDEHAVYLSLIPKGSNKRDLDRFKSRRRSERYSNEDFQF